MGDTDKINVNAEQWAMVKHSFIAQFINLAVILTCQFNNISIWYGLIFVTVCYCLFEIGQKVFGNGKNTFRRQLLTVFASIISYLAYLGIITSMLKEITFLNS